MKRLLMVIATLGIATCARKETQSGPRSSATTSAQTSTPVASPEDTYPMIATIVSRDPAKNTLNLDNKEVPGKMMAMKMAYEVRDAKVSALPPDGSSVVVTMHDQDGKYWITEVKPQPKK